MVYYKIPLTGGLDYPAGCILICAYTYEGYEYCKFERVTEVGSGWVSITESEFNVRCPDFPEPDPPIAHDVVATDATLADGSIVLTLPLRVDTGTLVKFTAPCACSDVTDGIVIDDVTYTIVDAAGNTADMLGRVWEDGALVSVLMDVESQKAYIQNASFSDALLKSGGTMTGTITTKGLRLTKGVDYDLDLPPAGNKDRLFFKVVS